MINIHSVPAKVLTADHYHTRFTNLAGTFQPDSWVIRWPLVGYDLEEAEMYFLLEGILVNGKPLGPLIVAVNLRGHYVLHALNPSVELPLSAHFADCSNWIYHQDLQRFEQGLPAMLSGIYLDTGKIQEIPYTVRGTLPFNTTELVPWIVGYQFNTSPTRRNARQWPQTIVEDGHIQIIVADSPEEPAPKRRRNASNCTAPGGSPRAAPPG